MKDNKRRSIENALRSAGHFGVTRAEFEADRVKYGTSFVRRIEELEEKLIIEKQFHGHFIVKWTYAGPRNAQPVAAQVEREVFIGSVAGCDFYEVRVD